MKHMWNKRWIRVLSGIICIFSFNLSVLSLVGIAACESLDIEKRDREDILEDAFESLCREYSIRALSDYGDNYNMDELKDTRFRYGVIRKNDIENLDLNDRKIYEVCSFEQDKIIDKEELYKSLTVYSCTIRPETYFRLGNPLLGNSYISNGYSYSETEQEDVEYVVKQVYYTGDTRHFYYLAQTEDGRNLIYPADEEIGQVEATIGQAEVEESQYQEVADLVRIQSGEEGVSYEWEADKNIRIIIEPDVSRYLADIELITYARLTEAGKIMPARGEEEYVEYRCSDGVIHTWENKEIEKDDTSYYVISYVQKGDQGIYTNNILKLPGMWGKMNDFSRVESLVDIVLKSHYSFYGIFLSALLVSFITLGICLRGAGHRFGDERVASGFLQKIPFDVFLVGIWLLIGLLLSLVVAVVSEGAYVSLAFSICIGIPALFLGELLALIFVMDFAVRLKTKSCLKSTLCFQCLRWAGRYVKKFFSWLKRGVRACQESLPMLWKAWIIMGFFAMVEFIFVAGLSNNGGLVVLFLLEKAVLYPLVTLCLLQMRRLKEQAGKLALGDMENTADTSRMFWEFKQHGDNLNKIREGINAAVEQRMKSERFKTELITNVSHDIKTPLTSIINYVDLLSKEDIENPKVQEYLEVLSRQSARLKKLIEDLMEASKASTGNLAVALESCNAGILVIQTIGEFEEKLKDSQIDLIVQGSEEEILIPADTRHLYRVFENLMNNICKYAQEGTRAYVNVDRRGDECEIIFRNISKYPLNIGSEELMERFVRGDSSRNTEGSGLGLSIANSLTELMKGRLTLVTDGDLFKVILNFPCIDKKPE
ncbi:MAG: HAMP domain-containing histidine kinase [Lachnospiraceae bacterium]|nr:HAMP domain-containing histidine kinase [Lachnospiraceae bacterium]